MTDLNSLIPPNSPLYLLHGYGINSSGEIVGLAYNTNAGEVHGFLAVPTNHGGQAGSAFVPADNGSTETRKYVLPENAREQLQQWVRFRRFAPSLADQQSLPSR